MLPIPLESNATACIMMAVSISWRVCWRVMCSRAAKSSNCALAKDSSAVRRAMFIAQSRAFNCSCLVSSLSIVLSLVWMSSGKIIKVRAHISTQSAVKNGEGCMRSVLYVFCHFDFRRPARRFCMNVLIWFAQLSWRNEKVCLRCN